MILVDSSVWIDHLRVGDAVLTDLLLARRVLVHPFVIGELELGNLRNRADVLELLSDLPQTKMADEQEILTFIERNGLPGTGIGYVDVHLLASVRLTGNCALWTRDRRLAEAAARLEICFAGGDPRGE